MRAETAPIILEQTPEEMVQLTLEQETYRWRQVAEPLSPTETLGNLVVSSVLGGALTGSVLPRTEAVTLELITGTAELGDNVQEKQKIAA